jgi:hypothetical protein
MMGSEVRMIIVTMSRHMAVMGADVGIFYISPGNRNDFLKK